jgi:predicted metal-dependent hydrolase
MSEPVINERERLHAEELMNAGVPIREWWFKDNAMLSFLLNASSTTVPEGERFIVRAAEDARKLFNDEALQKSAETLVHEEMAHARVHDAYNRYLEEFGFPAHRYSSETRELVEFFERLFSLKGRLAICAMIEHFTAIFAKQIFETGILEGEDTDERMDRIWSWHSLEELEHRSTAIDMYRRIGGGYFLRAYAALIGSILFAYIHTRCLFGFLRAKKLLWKWHTWRTGLPYIFGKKGVYRLFLTEWILYFKPGFHPYDIPIENRFQKQLHHYHIEEELVSYFPSATKV